jgi:hypothetical protein
MSAKFTNHVCWFTFSLDALPLMQSVTCAMETMPQGTTFWVFDQGDKPLPPQVQRWLQDRGVNVRLTTFDRRKNLNGKTSIEGQLACYAMTGAGENDVVWKVDSDTLVLRPDVYLDGYRKNWKLKGQGCYCPKSSLGWWGICYTLRGETLEPLRRAFTGADALVRLPEDIIISRALIHAVEGNETVTHQTKSSGGAYMNYNFRTGLTMEEYVRRFDILTFGDRGKIARLDGWQQRQKQAAAMAFALKTALPSRS